MFNLFGSKCAFGLIITNQHWSSSNQRFIVANISDHTPLIQSLTMSPNICPSKRQIVYRDGQLTDDEYKALSSHQKHRGKNDEEVLLINKQEEPISRVVGSLIELECVTVWLNMIASSISYNHNPKSNPTFLMSCFEMNHSFTQFPLITCGINWPIFWKLM